MQTAMVSDRRYVKDGFMITYYSLDGRLCVLESNLTKVLDYPTTASIRSLLQAPHTNPKRVTGTMYGCLPASNRRRAFVPVEDVLLVCAVSEKPAAWSVGKVTGDLIKRNDDSDDFVPETEEDDVSLESEVERLERMIKKLQKRVLALEKGKEERPGFWGKIFSNSKGNGLDRREPPRVTNSVGGVVHG